MIKKCTKCGLEKDISHFYRGYNYKDGFQGHCKECVSKLHSDKYVKKSNRQKRVIRPEEYIKTKKCRYCGEIKTLSEFTIMKNSPDGYNYRCKKCSNKYQKEFYASNTATKWSKYDYEKNLQLL